MKCTFRETQGKARFAMHIAPFDDETKKRLLRATVDLGRASGLEAAANVVAEMANHKGRVVGTNALRDLAELLSEKAAEIRAAANAEIKGMEKL